MDRMNYAGLENIEYLKDGLNSLDIVIYDIGNWKGEVKSSVIDKIIYYKNEIINCINKYDIFKITIKKDTFYDNKNDYEYVEMNALNSFSTHMQNAIVSFNIFYDGLVVTIKKAGVKSDSLLKEKRYWGNCEKFLTGVYEKEFKRWLVMNCGVFGEINISDFERLKEIYKGDFITYCRRIISKYSSDMENVNEFIVSLKRLQRILDDSLKGFGAIQNIVKFIYQNILHKDKEIANMIKNLLNDPFKGKLYSLFSTIPSLESIRNYDIPKFKNEVRTIHRYGDISVTPNYMKSIEDKIKFEQEVKYYYDIYISGDKDKNNPLKIEPIPLFIQFAPSYENTIKFQIREKLLYSGEKEKDIIHTDENKGKVENVADNKTSSGNNVISNKKNDNSDITDSVEEKQDDLPVNKIPEGDEPVDNWEKISGEVPSTDEIDEGDIKHEEIVSANKNESSGIGGLGYKLIGGMAALAGGAVIFKYVKNVNNKNRFRIEDYEPDNGKEGYEESYDFQDLNSYQENEIDELLDEDCLSIDFSDEEETVNLNKKFETIVSKNNKNDNRELAGNDSIENGTSHAVADPVNVSTGNFMSRKVDLKVSGYNSIEFSRFYNSIDVWKGTMGEGWHHVFESVIQFKRNRIIVVKEDGRAEVFSGIESGIEPLGNYKSKLLMDVEDNFIYEFNDNEKMIFSNKGRLLEIIDMNQNKTRLNYKDKLLDSVENDCGYMKFEYENNLLTKLIDNEGRFVEYIYKDGYLATVRGLDNELTHYEYAEGGELCKVIDENGNVRLQNWYDEFGRTVKQTTPDGKSVYFEYNDLEGNTTFKDKNGALIIYKKDSKKRILESVYWNGTSKKTFSDDGRITSEYDKNGNEITYKYNLERMLLKKIYFEENEYLYAYDGNGRIRKVTNPDLSYFSIAYDKNGNVVMSADEIGRETIYEYNCKGIPEKIQFPDKTTIEYKTDEKGNVIEIIDQNSNKTFYKYDNLNRVIEYLKPNGNKFRFEYSSKDNISKLRNPDDTIKLIEYNNRGLKIKEIDFNGYVSEYKYDLMDNLIEEKNQMGIKTEYKYDSMGNKCEVIYGDGSSIKNIYDKFNNLCEAVDEEGYVTRYEYDANGNCTKLIDPKGNEIIYKYNCFDYLVEKIDKNGGCFKYEYRYDGKIEKIIDPKGGIVEYEYDKAGQLITKKDSMGYVLRYEYSLMGLLTKTIGPEMEETRYDYNGTGRVRKIIYPDKTTEIFDYDKNDNLTKVENREGVIKQYNYDCMDRIIEIIYATGAKKFIKYTKSGKISNVTDENGNETRYFYDRLDRLVKIINPYENRIEYKYDEKDNLIEIQKFAGDENTEDDLINHNIIKYLYNKRGLLIKEIDAIGNSIEYKYDECGNLIGKVDKDGYETLYMYDSVGNVVKVVYDGEKETNYKYDELNNLIEMNDWNGKTIFEIDLIGRITKMVNYNGVNVNYVWKHNNVKASVSIENSIIEYEHDVMGRVKNIRLNSTIIESFEYNKIGNILKRETSSGYKSEYSYDESKRLIGITNYNNGKIIDELNYEYDSLLNKTSITQNNQKTEYSYDKLNRLIEIKMPDNKLKKYEYDSNGNRKNIRVYKNNEIIKELNYRYNALDQLVEIQGNENIEFKYDKRGNISKIIKDKEEIGYNFDCMNMLTNIEGIDKNINILYNGLYEKVSCNNKNFLYDYYENSFLSLNGDNTSTFIYNKGYIGIFENNIYKNQINNQKGSPIYIINNSSGKLIECGKFDEFGNSSDNDRCIGFAGLLNVQNTDLLYANSRYYLPEIGRFISEDLYKGDIYNIHNYYTYCDNNPVKLVDPSGFCSEYEPESKHIFEAQYLGKLNSQTEKIVGQYKIGKHNSIDTIFDDNTINNVGGLYTNTFDLDRYNNSDDLTELSIMNLANKTDGTYIENVNVVKKVSDVFNLSKIELFRSKIDKIMEKLNHEIPVENDNNICHRLNSKTIKKNILRVTHDSIAVKKIKQDEFLNRLKNNK